LKLGRKSLALRRSLVLAGVSHPQCRPEWLQPVWSGQPVGARQRRLVRQELSLRRNFASRAEYDVRSA